MKRVAVALFVGLLSATAHAQDKPGPSATPDEIAADALFEEGKRLMAASSFDAACEKFAASNRLSEGIGTSLWLGDCHERTGRLASAWYWFRAAADLAAKRDDKRREVASAKALALEPRLSKLRIESSNRAVTVLRNGAVVKPEELATDVPVDPAIVRVEARAAGKKPWSTVVDLRKEGVHTSVFVPPLADAVTPFVPPAKASPLRTIGFVGVGVGVLSLGASLALGGVAIAKQRASNDGHCHDANLCDAEGLALRDTALSFARASTAFFAIGLGAAGTGAILIAVAPSPSGPHVALAGRF
jgi:hypothetical protein